MKIKILGIWHNTHSKAGKEYISSKGKPYELCSIKDDKGYLSGFGNAQTKSWKIGDEIDIEVEVNGQYRNFRLPPQNVSRAEFEELKKRVTRVEDEIEMIRNEGKPESIEEIDFGNEPEGLGDEPEGVGIGSQ